MVFYCSNCENEFEVDDKECEGYYNWKCPECQLIAPKKDMMYGVSQVIWKCDTGTVKRGGSGKSASSACANCPNSK